MTVAFETTGHSTNDFADRQFHILSVSPHNLNYSINFLYYHNAASLGISEYHCQAYRHHSLLRDTNRDLVYEYSIVSDNAWIRTSAASKRLVRTEIRDQTESPPTTGPLSHRRLHPTSPRLGVSFLLAPCATTYTVVVYRNPLHSPTLRTYVVILSVLRQPTFPAKFPAKNVAFTQPIPF
jgi:hypothetical protein